MSKKNLTISIVVVLALLAYWVFMNKTQAPAVEDQNIMSSIEQQSSSDKTADIDAELNSIDTSGSSESDVNSMDAEVKTL